MRESIKLNLFGQLLHLPGLELSPTTSWTKLKQVKAHYFTCASIYHSILSVRKRVLCDRLSFFVVEYPAFEFASFATEGQMLIEFALDFSLACDTLPFQRPSSLSILLHFLLFHTTKLFND